MLFSCLVDADYSVSASDENEDYLEKTTDDSFDPKELLTRLNSYRDGIRKSSKANGMLNAIRDVFYDQCGKAGEENEEGLFTLTGPTGIGKTLALMHFSLRHCLQWNKKRIIGMLYCFLTVTFGWVLFRMEDAWSAVMIVSRMIRPWHYLQIAAIPADAYLDLKTVTMLIVSAAGAGALRKVVPEKWKEKWKNSAAEAVFCAVVLILCIAAIASDTYNPFIYFQF